MIPIGICGSTQLFIFVTGRAILNAFSPVYLAAKFFLQIVVTRSVLVASSALARMLLKLETIKISVRSFSLYQIKARFETFPHSLPVDRGMRQTVQQNVQRQHDPGRPRLIAA